MTIEHAGPFVESSVFSGHRAWVCFALYNYADDHGECWPSYESIATVARCDRSTAIRQVSWLEKHGVVAVLKGDDRPDDVAYKCGQANVFRVNLKFAWILGMLMRGIKDAVGRRAKDRNKAVRIVANWVEKSLAESGVDVVIAAIEKILNEREYRELLKQISGGTVPLSPKRDSRTVPPPGVANEAQNGGQESHDVPPKPSDDLSGDPSSPSAEDNSGEKGDTVESSEKVPKALRWRIRDLIIQWVLLGSVDRFNAKRLRFGADFNDPGIASIADFRIPGCDFDGEQAQSFVLLLPLTVRKEVAGAVDWVKNHIAGTDPNEPAKPFKPLEESFRSALKSKSRDNRITCLRESVVQDDAAHTDKKTENSNEEAA